MKKQDNSPLKFAVTSLYGPGGVASSFKSGGGLAGLARRMRAANMAETQATDAAATMGPAPADVTMGSAPDSATMGSAPADAAMGPAPADVAMGSAGSANPFEGRTFTISPAQMRNVENVFGDTNERQASVGQGMEQSSENYDAYGEESPLMKKSCGSYKK